MVALKVVDGKKEARVDGRSGASVMEMCAAPTGMD